MRGIQPVLCSAAAVGLLVSIAACLDFSAEEAGEPAEPAEQETNAAAEGEAAQEDETTEEPAEGETDGPEDPVALSIEVEELAPAEEGALAYAYTMRLTNYSADLDSARLVHMIPAGLEHQEATPEPDEVSELEAAWEISLPAGDYLEISREVGADSAEEFAEASADGQLLEIEDAESEDEFSSTVCVYEEAGQESLACESVYTPQP